MPTARSKLYYSVFRMETDETDKQILYESSLKK